jgi:hypothetical protein
VILEISITNHHRRYQQTLNLNSGATASQGDKYQKCEIFDRVCPVSASAYGAGSTPDGKDVRRGHPLIPSDASLAAQSFPILWWLGSIKPKHMNEK